MSEEEKKRYAALMTEETERLGRERYGPTMPLFNLFVRALQDVDLLKQANRSAKERFDRGDVPKPT